jgi:beta-lactamase class D OXA-9
MKKILLLNLLVFVLASHPIYSVASDEVEPLKCTIIADAITGNTLYEAGRMCPSSVSVLVF